MNLCNLRNSFRLKEERKWDTLYVLLDVHGVIIPGSLHGDNELKFISDACIEVLRWFSSRKDIRIILWTSSYTKEITKIIEWLDKYNIEIDYVNFNPECINTAYADFRDKPYFNILIDDKSGFEPDKDWGELKMQLIGLGEWDRKI